MLKQKTSEYRGYRTAGIRLNEEMLPHLAQLYGERTKPMQAAMHAFDKAHTVMLVEEGLLKPEHGAAILKGMRTLEGEGEAATRARVGGGLHSGEQYLIRLLGEEVAGRFHLARSSGDLSAVGINWLQREKLLMVMRGVNAMRRVLLELVPQTLDAIMPGYSFGQHAQPLTLAHLYLSWVATLERDFDRLQGCYRRINVSAAGAAIMVGSDFIVNRARTAALLGFDAVHENCADGILELNADDSLDVPSVLAVLYHSMAKWGDDLMQWTTSEYHFVDIPDRYCSTSSIMMQKRNVIGPAEIKGASAEALGCFVTSYHVLKGPTGLPITERYYALEMLWRVADNCARDLAGSASCCRALVIRREHMLEMAWKHWATVTDLAGALVREKDLPWRTAHQIVGVMIRLCEERGLGPADVTPAILDEAAMLSHEQPAGLSQATIDAMRDPARFVAVRTVQGGPAAPKSLRQARLFGEHLARDVAVLAAMERRLADAAQALEAAVDAVIARGAAGGD